MRSLMLIYNQFGIIQNLQTSPIPQTIFLVGTFYAASYSKTALVAYFMLNKNKKNLLKYQFDN